MNSDLDFSKIINLIVKILKKYPFAREKIVKHILQKMPHSSFPLIAHSVSLAILLSLVYQLPVTESDIIEFIVEKITNFDAEVHLSKFNFNLTMRENSEIVLKKEIKQCDLKLDLYMNTLLNYVKT